MTEKELRKPEKFVKEKEHNYELKDIYLRSSLQK